MCWDCISVSVKIATNSQIVYNIIWPSENVPLPCSFHKCNMIPTETKETGKTESKTKKKNVLFRNSQFLMALQFCSHSLLLKKKKKTQNTVQLFRGSRENVKETKRKENTEK